MFEFEDTLVCWCSVFVVEVLCYLLCNVKFILDFILNQFQCSHLHIWQCTDLNATSYTKSFDYIFNHVVFEWFLLLHLFSFSLNTCNNTAFWRGVQIYLVISVSICSAVVAIKNQVDNLSSRKSCWIGLVFRISGFFYSRSSLPYAIDVKPNKRLWMNRDRTRVRNYFNLCFMHRNIFSPFVNVTICGGLIQRRSANPKAFSNWISMY